MSTVRACIGLGSNLDEPRRHVQEAVRELARLPHSRLVAVSRLYRSAPVDAAGPDYVNAVAAVDTMLEPLALLQRLQAIEGVHGRERSVRNAPRTLDLDLLLHGSVCLQTGPLVLPHPRLHLRAFVLRPLLDIDPEARIPGLGPAAEWLQRCADQRIELMDTGLALE